MPERKKRLHGGDCRSLAIRGKVPESYLPPLNVGKGRKVKRFIDKGHKALCVVPIGFLRVWGALKEPHFQ
jgi:hypothetical protein